MSKVKIQRHNQYMNRFTIYKILIDNKEVWTIWNGEVQEFKIPEGKHSILIKIDWRGSQVLDINIWKHQTKIVEVSNFQYSWIILLWLILIPVYYISVPIANLLTYAPARTYTFIPVVLIFLYYLTFGRNEYLVLSEVGNDI